MAVRLVVSVQNAAHGSKTHENWVSVASNRCKGVSLESIAGGFDGGFRQGVRHGVRGLDMGGVTGGGVTGGVGAKCCARL